MKKHLWKLSSFISMPLVSLAAISCSNNQNIPPRDFPMLNVETGLYFNSEGTITKYLYSGVDNYTNIVIPEYLENNSVLTSEYYRYKQRITKIGHVVFSAYTESLNDKPIYNEYAQYLKSITLPNSIETIGAEAFYGTPLTQIVLPDSVTYIAGGAFHNCKNLESVKLSKNTRDIGTRSFQGTAITSIEIPNTVMYIHDDAFRDTKLNGSLYIPDSVIWIYQGAFEGTEITEVSVSRRCRYYLNGTFPANCKIITRL